MIALKLLKRLLCFALKTKNASCIELNVSNFKDCPLCMSHINVGSATEYFQTVVHYNNWLCPQVIIGA